jgi:hypothetical protein
LKNIETGKKGQKIDSANIFLQKQEGFGEDNTMKYLIKVESGETDWTIIKRYNDFYFFHNHLKNHFKTQEIPYLTGKIIIDKKNKEKNERKQRKLNAYLEKILLMQSDIVDRNEECKIAFEEFFYSNEESTKSSENNIRNLFREMVFEKNK